MAYEDFLNDYADKTDPNSRISETDTRCTHTALSRDEHAHTSRDAGLNHFSGDFTHQFELMVTAEGGNGGQAGKWALANSQLAEDEWETGSENAVWVFNYHSGATSYTYLGLIQSGTPTQSTAIAISMSTLYYVTIERDDDAPSPPAGNGQYTLRVYTGSHYPTGTEVGTVTLNSSSKYDFRYIYGCVSRDTNDAANTLTGYTQNLELNEAVSALSVSVNDSVSVTDVPAAALNLYEANVNDAISVTDVPSIALDLYEANVNDPVTVSDVPAAALVLKVNVNDSVGVTDSVTASTGALTQVIRYVDPEATGLGNGTSWTDAYTSLNAWTTGEATDLVAANQYHTVYCRSLGGTADTTACTISGWTSDATHYTEVIGTDFPANGIYDTGAYRLEVSDNSLIYTFGINHARFINLQFKSTESSTNNAKGFDLNPLSGSSYYRIDSCIIVGACSGTGSGYGVYVNDASTVVDIFNTVIYGFKSGADTGFAGINVNNSSTVNIYNCTIEANYYGISRVAGTVNAYNCAVFNNDDDFSGIFNTIDYCASDDGDDTGVNAQDFTAEATDWNKVFNNYSTGDFSLKNYTTSPCCVNRGTDNPGSGLYSDDIAGAPRISVWDIGSFESINLAVDVNDTVSVTDSGQAEVNLYEISVSDSISVTDISLAGLDLYLTSVNESVSVADAVSASIALAVGVNEAISVAESVSAAITLLEVNVNDSVSVTDAVSVVDALFLISVNESVSVSENTETILSPLILSVNDSLSVTDYSTATIINPTLSVDVNDSVVVVDVISLLMTFLWNAVTESNSVTWSVPSADNTVTWTGATENNTVTWTPVTGPYD